VRAIKTILTFRITHAEDEWIPDVVKTVASKGKGVEDVIGEIERHITHLEKTGDFSKRRITRDRERVIELVESMLRMDLWNDQRQAELRSMLERITRHEMTCYEAAEELVNDFKAAEVRG
jgi:LAO/AO transport system kinase